MIPLELTFVYAVKYGFKFILGVGGVFGCPVVPVAFVENESFCCWISFASLWEKKKSVVYVSLFPNSYLAYIYTVLLLQLYNDY